jgi:hypothetical protein
VGLDHICRLQLVSVFELFGLPLGLIRGELIRSKQRGEPPGGPRARGESTRVPDVKTNGVGSAPGTVRVVREAKASRLPTEDVGGVRRRTL